MDAADPSQLSLMLGVVPAMIRLQCFRGNEIGVLPMLVASLVQDLT